MIKKATLLALFLLLILALFNFQFLRYGLGQAKGQLRVIRGVQPIEELISDPQYPDSLKAKFQLIEEVRTFCVEDLGMTDSDNYTTYFDQKGETILWNLSASKPYKLEPYTWSFPFLGSFPYKGFFDLEKARSEQKDLIELGLDTRIRPVNGWSTLGWFSDPILSNMLERSDGRLADLIIHELTHSTLFIKDDITFNENLASFIGQRGAHSFLSKKFGEGSEQSQAYLSEQSDSKKFIEHILNCAELLSELYKSLEVADDSTKNIHKHLIIDEIIASLDTVSFRNSRYHHIFDQSRPNNAYFMSFLRYHSVEDSLQILLEKEYGSDLKAFVKGMKEYHDN